MTGHDFILIAPFVSLAVALVTIMIVIAVRRCHLHSFLLAQSAIILAFIAITQWAAAPSTTVMGSLLTCDGYAAFFGGLILCGGFFTLLLSWDYLQIHEEHPEEYYILILAALLGALILTSAVHIISFFLGLEILSISLYSLIAYNRHNELSIEAGIKYLVLAAFSSALLVFGMAIIYNELGTMSFSGMAEKMTASGGKNLIVFSGLALITAGVGFKLALVPFHMWAADVYEGAGAPVTAFIATVSKGAVFAVFLRYFLPVDMNHTNALSVFLIIISVASMFAGNLLALFQDNVKRLLAYSSIAHMGYLLVAFLGSGKYRITAAALYLAAYFITTLGAFGVVTVLSGKDHDADKIADYRGLFYRRPWLAGIFTAMLLSLAGIPLTAGFIGKFFVMAAGINNVLWIPVISLVVASAIGLFYYLRLIITIYTPAAQEAREISLVSMPAAIFVLVIMTLLLFGLGIYPQPLLLIVNVMQY